MSCSRRQFVKLLSWWGLSTAAISRADTTSEVLLIPQPKVGETMQVNALLEVGGDLRMAEGGVIKTLKMSVVGKIGYAERLLTAVDGLKAGHSARLYEQAEAVIKIEKGGMKPILRTDRRQIGVQLASSQATLYSPEGPLMREEVDLLDIPGNSLLVNGLLPRKAVNIGDTWTHDDEWLAAFLGLDAVGKSQVESQLIELDADKVRLELKGNVHGAIHGVATEMVLQGRYKFDRKLERVTWLALLIDEKRAVGHVGPGADVTSRLQMTLVPVETPALLSDDAIATIDWNYSPNQAILEYRSESGRFGFLHDRRWHVMKDSPESVALRLIERGELMAQCNVTILPNVKPGERFSLTQFQEDMQRTLGKNFGQFLEASEAVNSRGLTVVRVAAAGTVSELPIQWNYYLIADRDGHQLVLAFTVELEQIAQLAESDAAIIESVEFTTPNAQAAASGATTR